MNAFCFSSLLRIFAWRSFLLLVLQAATLAAQPMDADAPLRVSENRRYLVDRQNAPFLLQGDAAWSLIANTTRDEAAAYLRNRREKGFNAVLVNLIEHKFAKNPPRNLTGEAPFAGATDFAAPNEKYFAFADGVIREAAANGIVVLLAPIYLGYPDRDEGFFDELMATDPEKCRAYGRFLGRRYRDFDNLLWVMGGDRDPGPARARVDLIAAGIREFDRRHLMTAHCHGGTNPIEAYPGSWLQVGNTYNYEVVHLHLIWDHDRKPVLPYFLIEAIYEGEHNASEVQIRRQAYWSVLCGEFGHVMGNHPIWDFSAGWPAALDAPGSVAMMHWGRLFRSRPWQELVPDQEHQLVTGGLGEFWGNDYVAAAATPDGRTLIAYLPNARTITVDLARLGKARFNAWWFDPRTGQAAAGGTFAPQPAQQFTPPAGGDWAFVLDDAALALPPPGGAVAPK
jgi:hypothetical protein